MPPIYWLTGSQASATSGRVGVLACGAVKRTKYQDESTNVSIVSVSRVATPPQLGQATCFQVGCRSSGLPGASKVTSSGSFTGRSASGTGTTPHSAQWMTGIGQPQ